MTSLFQHHCLHTEFMNCVTNNESTPFIYVTLPYNKIEAFCACAIATACSIVRLISPINGFLNVLAYC